MKNIEYYLQNLNIIYEDNHLLVVEKFINVLSQKDNTGDLDMTDIIKLYIKRKYNKLGNVYLGLLHRLDRRVGGVMVFAKTSKAAKRLSADIRARQFAKTYLACLYGNLVEDGSIDIKLLKQNQKAIVSPKGKKALLHYQVINNINNKTYVKIDLITGRYNQIRASFAHIGYPVINDHKYHQGIKPNRDALGLYCYRIKLNHPVTKEKLTFTSYPKGEIWEDMK